MLNWKILLITGLLLLTGITYAVVSRSSQISPATQNTEQAPGQMLANQITPTPSQTPTVRIPTPSPVPVRLDKKILGEHHVALGETLECIGRGYRVSPAAIAELNQIGLASELKIGQILKIPAVPWIDISSGPVCPPQFIPPDWDSALTEQVQLVSTPRTNDNAPEGPSAASPGLQEFHIQSETPCSAMIQAPCGGNTLPPVKCCETCLVTCTETPPRLRIITDTPQKRVKVTITPGVSIPTKPPIVVIPSRPIVVTVKPPPVVTEPPIVVIPSRPVIVTVKPPPAVTEPPIIVIPSRPIILFTPEAP